MSMLPFPWKGESLDVDPWRIMGEGEGEAEVETEEEEEDEDDMFGVTRKPCPRGGP